MATIRTVTLPWNFIITDNTSPHFFPITQWMSAADVRKVRATWEARFSTGTFKVAVGYQCAQAPDDIAGNTGTISSQLSSTTYDNTDWLDLTGETTDPRDFQLIRFGYMVEVDSGEGSGMMTARLDIQSRA